MLALALALAMALSVGGIARAQQDIRTEGFTIEDIRVEGLQRIIEGTVFNHLPYQVGDFFSAGNTAETIRELYLTGFFDDVRLERDGDTLVVIVEERPAIGKLEIAGNKKVKTEDLLAGLAELGFVEGRVFDRQKLSGIRRELTKQYFALGRYAAHVTTDIAEMDANRVAITINISEGGETKIRKINITGNSHLSDKKILGKFKSIPPWYNFIIGGGGYSRELLAGDLEALRSRYQDEGFIRFEILSTQVSISADRSDIFITINLSEGSQYRISDLRVAGDIEGREDDLAGLVALARGDLFSRKGVTASTQAMTALLGEEGYAFANVNAVPDINDEDLSVVVTFVVDQDSRAYVRRIEFEGNDTTRDEVLRREMRQQESAPMSTENIERGRLRLERLGFFDSVNVETTEVPGIPDQVDVKYTVRERPAGNLLLGLGYTQNQGPVLRFSITQENFAGTGNRISLEFNNSDVNRRFRLDYLNPYYTIDGVSRGFNVGYREVDSADANISTYNLEAFDFGVRFGIPLSEETFLNSGLTFERNDFGNIIRPAGADVCTSATSTITEVQRFVHCLGGAAEFNVFRWGTSFTYDSRNRALLPDRGQRHRLSLDVSLPIGDTVDFYRLNYRPEWYVTLLENLPLLLRGDFGYGDGYGDVKQLPFFERFFLGGPRSLRGYEDNTIGPKDRSNRATGGNLKVFASAEVIWPLPFLGDDNRQFRLTTFYDTGNVYNLDNDAAEDFGLGNLRSSIGIGALWLSPVGILTVSLAKAIGDETGDRLQTFQFTFGTSF